MIFQLAEINVERTNPVSKEWLNFLVVCSLAFLFPDNALSQSVNIPDRSYRIVAARYGKDVYYKPGTRLCVKYKRGNDEVKERGFFAGALDEKIILTPDKAGSYRISINPDDIIYIRKIKPLNRIIAGAAGTVMFAGGLLLLTSGTSSAEALGAALIGIPLMALGYVVLYYIPITLIIEKINEKKRSKGWDFRLSDK